MKNINIKELINEKYGIYRLSDLLPYKWKMYFYDYIKPIFKPNNKKVRDAIPRKWVDLSHLITEVNFAIIKQFYEDEYLLGMVDWKASGEGHQKFEKWLKKAYTYVSHTRPSLEAERDNAYPPLKPLNELFAESLDENGKKTYTMVDDGIPYKVKYKDVIRLEKKINSQDTKILSEMIGYREYFWT